MALADWCLRENYLQGSDRQDSTRTVGIYHDEYSLSSALTDLELPSGKYHDWDRFPPLRRAVVCQGVSSSDILNLEDIWSIKVTAEALRHSSWWLYLVCSSVSIRP